MEFKAKSVKAEPFKVRPFISESLKRGPSILFCTSLLFLLGGCGGSSEPEVIEEPPEVVEPTPEPTPDPTPDPIASENPQPPTKGNVATDISSLSISNLSISRNDSNSLVISFEGQNAESYRVLFWASDGTLYDDLTTNLSVRLSQAISGDGGLVMVEAYDAFGNSVFSNQVNVEAI